MPDGQHTQRPGALIISAEDGPAGTIVPRASCGPAVPPNKLALWVTTGCSYPLTASTNSSGPFGRSEPRLWLQTPLCPSSPTVLTQTETRSLGGPCSHWWVTPLGARVRL